MRILPRWKINDRIGWCRSIFMLISTARREKYTQNISVKCREFIDERQMKWKTKSKSLFTEIEHRFQEVKKGCERSVRADGLCNGSRVKQEWKNCWAVTGHVSGRSAGGFVPFTKTKHTSSHRLFLYRMILPIIINTARWLCSDDHGGLPVAISQRVHPIDQISAFFPWPVSAMTSGAIQLAVPEKEWFSFFEIRGNWVTFHGFQ